MAQIGRSATATRTRMSIGEVIERLSPDFPGLTISKIRFLEAEGLVEPERTPSGYRKFSADDVERLRYVLTAQRDHYLPLKVIREHLDAIDRGLEPPELSNGEPRVPHAVVEGAGGVETFLAPPPRVRLSRAELLEAAGVDEPMLAALENYGLVRSQSGGHYDGDALLIARTAGELASYGVEPRHLRAVKTAADREVGLLEQVVSAVRRGREAGAQARAEEMATQIAALFVRLHATLVRSGLQT